MTMTTDMPDVVTASRAAMEQDLMERQKAATASRPPMGGGFEGGPRSMGPMAGGFGGPIPERTPAREEAPVRRPEPQPQRNNQPAAKPQRGPQPQIKSGATWMDFFRALSKISGSGIDWSTTLVFGSMFMVMLGVWVVCCWSAILTAHAWGWVKLAKVDPIAYITTAPIAFFVAGFVYVLVTRYEMHLWPKRLISLGYSGWTLAGLLFCWFIVSGIDFTGVFTYTNQLMNNLSFDLWNFHISLPNNQWYTVVVKVVVTALEAFGTERVLIFAGREFAKGLGIKVK